MNFVAKYMMDYIKWQQKENAFEKQIKEFIQSSNSVLFLPGPIKIGKTISILNIMDKLDLRYLYEDFKYINSLKENDKKIYLFQEFLDYLLIILAIINLLKNIMNYSNIRIIYLNWLLVFLNKFLNNYSLMQLLLLIIMKIYYSKENLNEILIENLLVF